MGAGYSTPPVVCSDYTTADAIDSTINAELDAMEFEAHEMLAYSWISCGAWIYYFFTIERVTAIE